MSVTALLFISFAVLLILNVPVSMALAFSSIICVIKEGLLMELISIQVYTGMAKFLLLAVPFFIFAGNLMADSGISDRLINLCRACVGHRRSGMIMVTVLTSCFFAAISGSGPATVAALGSILLPAMRDDGYDPADSGALMATSGAIGTVIPPSIPFVVYGLVTGVSITNLFLSGMIPGILMGIALIVVSIFVNRNNKNIVIHEKASAKERWTAFKDAVWGLLMPVIILGGIYSGIFTPTEAAGVACVYGIIVGMFVYRKLTPKMLYKCLCDSVVASGNVMIIIACAAVFSWFCSTCGITTAASNLLGSVAHNQFQFLLIVNILLLIAGCFVESSSAIYILAPIIIPVAKTVGYDLTALGTVFILNLAIGNVTPPVGLNLFVACGINKITVKQISKGVVPYILASLAVLFLITYVPQISLLLIPK